jgi:hypothetical protein
VPSTSALRRMEHQVPALSIVMPKAMENQATGHGGAANGGLHYLLSSSTMGRPTSSTLSTRTIKQNGSRPLQHHPPSSPPLENQALFTLCRLLGNPDASWSWSCPEQMITTTSIYALQKDMLAIMHTGSGKSMLIQYHGGAPSDCWSSSTQVIDVGLPGKADRDGCRV